MNSKMKANRSSVVPEAADKCDPTNPFCATHPRLSDLGVSRKSSEPEDGRFSRRAEIEGLRGHVRAEHVTVSKKRK